MIRRLEIAVLVLLMASFGVGVYSYLGTLRAAPKVAAHAAIPTHTKPRFTLPGTMFLAQGGAIFRLQAGTFTQIATGGWTQPTLTPDHSHLVAVARSSNSSDLYLLDLDGHVVRQLTHNATRNVPSNHWSFFPKVSPDGKTLFYSWDPKDPYNGYRVDLAVYAMPISGTQAQARRWTFPYYYTGGDVQPVPLPSGMMLYAKYDLSDQGQVYSQIWLSTRAGAVGRPLTTPQDDCSYPSLSPDGTQVAMTCTGGQQVSRIEVAHFDGTNLGPLKVVLDGQMAAAPSWSPDGQGLAYFAPTGASGHFQLFYLQLPVTQTPAASATARPSASAKPSATPAPIATPAPPAPRQVSTDLDFDTTAPPAWY